MIIKFCLSMRSLAHLALLSGLLLLVSTQARSADENHLTPADRGLPQFSLMALDGSQWNAESLSGKPWLINFWASWCPPCIEELPSMNTAWQVLQDKGVGMLAINAGEGAASVETFLTKMNIDFPHVLGDVDSLANWSIRALPTTLLVNADGQVVFEALGPRDWDDEALLAQILELL